MDDRLFSFMEEMGMQDLCSQSIKDFLHSMPTMETPANKGIISFDASDYEYLLLVPLYDLHYGAKSHALPLLKQTIEFIDKTPNCVTVIGGDALESATKMSIGLGMLEETDHLQEQMWTIEALLEPLARKGKIIGSVLGNHEYRNVLFNEFNPIKELSKNLGIPYLGYQGFIALNVGDQIYRTWMHHGTGASRTKGAKVNSAVRPNTVANADLYITGHLHDKFVVNDSIMEFDIENMEVIQRTRWYMAAGSFLQYFGGYPEMGMLAPTLPGTLLAEFSSREKRINFHI